MDNDHAIAISLGPHYQQLKQLDELLDLGRQAVDQAESAYQETFEHFATLCHQLWRQEKAQGSRQGKGFRQSLQNAGINVNRAYRAMRKFFPADFPVQPKKPKNKKISTSFAANEVDHSFVRCTGELLEGNEVFECKFALTPEDKTDFFKALKFVDPSQLWSLLLDAVKQAARQAQSTPKSSSRSASMRDGVKVPGSPSRSDSSHDKAETPSTIPAKPQTLSDNQKSKIENLKSQTVSLAAATAVPGEPNNRKSEVENLKSEIQQDPIERLVKLHQRLRLQGHYPSLDPMAKMYAPEHIHAALDWVDTNPEWSVEWRHKSAVEFLDAFESGPIQPDRRY